VPLSVIDESAASTGAPRSTYDRGSQPSARVTTNGSPPLPPLSSALHIRDEQARELFRIFEEGLELAGSGEAQTAHVIDRVRGLIRAVIGGEALVKLAPVPEVRRWTDCGWPTESELERFRGYYAVAGIGANPLAARMMEIYRPGFEMTVRREEIMTDDEWRRSPFFGEVLIPCRLDHSIHSLRAGEDPDILSGLGFARATGDRPFDESDRDTIQLFHRGLLPILRWPSRKQADTRRKSLTAREEAVMSRLLDGMSDKQIATDLGISPHTASQHVGAIFRKMGVRSRAELFALYVKRRGRRAHP